MTGRGPYRPRRAVKKPQTLGERLVVVRRALGFSQATLATAVGVPQQSISSWERGLTEPSGPGMRMLTGVLGVTATALRTGKGFTIPDAPPLLEGRVGKPQGGEGYVAIEDGKRKSIALPAAAPGDVWGVDAASGQNVPLSKEQALAWLADAIDSQAPVWIVSRPVVKVKRTRATTGTRSKT